MLIQPRILPEQGRDRAAGSARRILCIFPRYTPSFGTFQYAYRLIPRVKAFMPPQGLLLIAAHLPKGWQVRFVDENIRPARPRDFRWADAVFVSGMHIQRRQIQDITRRAHAHNKLVVLGGPSVSSAPEYYPEVDLLHIGEMGDATDALFQRLDRTCDRPSKQLIFETGDRLPLEQFPVPAYHLLDLGQYLMASVQFSSGCPFMCEFCDIPALYGRSPRLKTAPQIQAELDAILAAGARGAVYFVDDNFIANRNATRDMLPHLIAWQKSRGYRLRFACEATLDMAQHPDLLALMRQARFETVFCGIETPETGALRAMDKKQNLRLPILDAVRTLNDHGLEVVSGIILGLDTDTPDTAQTVLDFIELSGIPMLTINLLYALPRTHLYDRLKAQGRLVDDPARETNVIYRMPLEQVQAMWRRCIGEAYDPPRLFARFVRQTEQTYRNRPRFKQKVRLSDVVMGLNIIGRILWHVGWRSTYREHFWRVARPLIRQGRIESVIHIAIVTHHLIRFTQQCLHGHREACFYADHTPRPTATAPIPAAAEA